MIMDFQFGSTGKGLLAGYLAKRGDYDTAVCAFATNAGHTYIDKSRDLEVMTQQLPTAITSPTVSNILLGPGSLIHPKTLREELDRYSKYLADKRVMIHPHAAIVEDYHRDLEIEWGMSKMGSTTKGVGAAMIERIRRQPKMRPHERGPNVAKFRLFGPGSHGLYDLVVTEDEYRQTLEKSESTLIEGAQGFSLSMYHGFYPYTTSRDVSPWQIAADCGLPFKWAPYINIYGTLRTYPIRVNNRDGSSGPGYSDQVELQWGEIGVDPELTTVTKLPRRIFSFSQQQLREALWHCGQYWQTKLFLNFVNYLPHNDAIHELMAAIEQPGEYAWNPPKVECLGFGPDDSQVMARETFNTLHSVSLTDSEGGEV